VTCHYFRVEKERRSKGKLDGISSKLRKERQGNQDQNTTSAETEISPPENPHLLNPVTGIKRNNPSSFPSPPQQPEIPLSPLVKVDIATPISIAHRPLSPDTNFRIGIGNREIEARWG
jgi:hypothetical protein